MPVRTSGDGEEKNGRISRGKELNQLLLGEAKNFGDLGDGNLGSPGERASKQSSPQRGSFDGKHVRTQEDPSYSRESSNSASCRGGYFTSTGFAVPAARSLSFWLNSCSSEGTQYSSLSSVRPLGSCKLKTDGFALTKGAT